MRAVLARQAVVAPAELTLGGWRLLLLASHRPGEVGGWLGSRQRTWLRQRLRRDSRPTLVAVHHPPLPIGDPVFDAIGLRDGPELAEILAGAPHVAAVLCGHVHQHWQGMLPGAPTPAEATVVLACPSTLCPFPAVQPCPLGRADDPGGRLLELRGDGRWRQTLLRWRPWPEPAETDPST
jgi:Icc protein